MRSVRQQPALVQRVGPVAAVVENEHLHGRPAAGPHFSTVAGAHLSSHSPDVGADYVPLLGPDRCPHSRANARTHHNTTVRCPQHVGADLAPHEPALPADHRRPHVRHSNSSSHGISFFFAFYLSVISTDIPHSSADIAHSEAILETESKTHSNTHHRAFARAVDGAVVRALE